MQSTDNSKINTPVRHWFVSTPTDYHPSGEISLLTYNPSMSVSLIWRKMSEYQDTIAPIPTLIIIYNYILSKLQKAKATLRKQPNNLEGPTFFPRISLEQSTLVICMSSITRISFQDSPHHEMAIPYLASGSSNSGARQYSPHLLCNSGQSTRVGV